MSLQLIAGSGALRPDGGLTCTMKDVRSGSHVAVSITNDAMAKLRGDADPSVVLERYHTVLELTAGKKYDDTGCPHELALVDTDFVGG